MGNIQRSVVFQSSEWDDSRSSTRHINRLFTQHETTSLLGQGAQQNQSPHVAAEGAVAQLKLQCRFKFKGNPLEINTGMEIHDQPTSL